MKTWSQDSVRSTLKYLWIFSIFLLIWQGYSSYSKLPDQLATHFDMSGKPDGWSSKGNFFVTWYAVILGINALTIFMTLMITKGKFPASILNVPNKDYWLATEERKEECIKRIEPVIFATFSLTNITFSIVYQAIIQSNIETIFRFPVWSIFVPLVIMFIYVFAYLATAFKKPEGS